MVLVEGVRAADPVEPARAAVVPEVGVLRP